MPIGYPTYLPTLALIVIFVVLPLMYVGAIIKALVSLRCRIRESWAHLEVELKHRYELIPQILATVRTYNIQETAVLGHVIQARARCMANNGSPSARADDENRLVKALREFLVLLEEYPVVKIDQTFLKLEHDLFRTEERIQTARQFFNGHVRDYRGKRETFPANLVARLGGFKIEEYFNVDPVAQTTPP